MSSVTFHNMFGPIPILSPSADFEIAQQDPKQARVKVRYSDPRDKDIRVSGQETEELRTIKVVVEGHEVILSPGDSIYFDSRHGHGLRAMGGNPVKLLAVIL